MQLLIIIFGTLAVILYWSLTYKSFRNYGVWETISSRLKVKAIAWIMRFYQRLGYEVLDKRTGHAGYEDFLMIKDLL